MAKKLFIVCAGYLLALSISGLPASAWVLEQQWTKTINSGTVFYHFRLRLAGGPAHIYVLEVDPRKGYSVRPVIANNLIGTLAPVDKLARDAGAICAINGGFFDTQGEHLPVGLIKIDYKTIFEQFLPRPVLGIDHAGRAHFEVFSLRSFLRLTGSSLSIPLNGYNRKRKFGEVIAFSSEFGKSTKTNPWGREVILKRVSPLPGAIGEANLLGEKYIIVGEAMGNSTIPGDGLVVSFHSAALKSLKKAVGALYLGEEVEVVTALPKGWEKFPHLLGGGPMIIKDGRMVLDFQKELFSSQMNRPLARTAVGETSEGKILLIVVDKGNKAYSVGATWEQLGVVGGDLLHLRNLMGFDGGGSSTMFIENKVVNEPSGGAPRAVANILGVVPISSSGGH